MLNMPSCGALYHLVIMFFLLSAALTHPYAVLIRTKLCISFVLSISLIVICIIELCIIYCPQFTLVLKAIHFFKMNDNKVDLP